MARPCSDRPAVVPLFVLAAFAASGSACHWLATFSSRTGAEAGADAAKPVDAAPLDVAADARDTRPAPRDRGSDSIDDLADASAPCPPGVGCLPAGPPTVAYGSLLLSAPPEGHHLTETWDLTLCDVVLAYDLDMGKLTQQPLVPPDDPWNQDHAIFAAVGLRQLGAEDINPGSFGQHPGGAGGWMISFITNLGPEQGPEPRWDTDDIHHLTAAGGVSYNAYDVVDPGRIEPATVATSATFGVRFDRDGISPTEASQARHVKGATYRTKGGYTISVRFHAIDQGSGTMFASVNGVAQGFYSGAEHGGLPEIYPAGLSFVAKTTEMRAFAFLIGYAKASGEAQIDNLRVWGCPP